MEELVATLKKAGAKEVHCDPLNPYPAAVRRLRAVYRTSFPRALEQLENYLRDRRGYLQQLAGRSGRLAREIGGE